MNTFGMRVSSVLPMIEDEDYVELYSFLTYLDLKDTYWFLLTFANTYLEVLLENYPDGGRYVHTTYRKGMKSLQIYNYPT